MSWIYATFVKTAKEAGGPIPYTKSLWQKGFCEGIREGIRIEKAKGRANKVFAVIGAAVGGVAAGAAAMKRWMDYKTKHLETREEQSINMKEMMIEKESVGDFSENRP